MTAILSHDQAYERWLGVPSGAPPHHYHLLGLALFESRPAAIAQGFQQQSQRLTPHLSSPAAAVAERLLGELAAAQACLLDPTARAKYDAQLQTQLGSPGGDQPKRPTPRSRSAVAPAGGLSASAAAVPACNGPPPVIHDPEEPSSAVPWIVGGACVGLIGVATLAAMLFVAAGSRRPGPTATRDNHGNHVDRSGARTAELDAALQGGEAESDSPSSELDSGSTERVAPSTAAPSALDAATVGIRRTGDGSLLTVDELDEPAEPAKPEETSAPPPVSPAPPPPPPDPAAITAKALADLPRAVALPPLDVAGPSGAPLLLAPLPVAAPAELSLRLGGADLVDAQGRFEFQPPPDDTAPRVWRLDYTDAAGATEPVAEYSWADGELNFRWLPGAGPASAEILKNRNLHIVAGDHSAALAQRLPDAVGPLAVKFDSGAVGANVTLAPPPGAAKLVLQVDALDEAFGPHRWSPAARVEAGDEADLILGGEQDPYQLALRFSFEATGPERVRVEYRPMLRAAGSAKWDYFRPKSAAVELAQLQQQETLLATQLSQLPQQFRRNPAGFAQASDALNRQSLAVRSRIDTLESLSRVCQAVQDKATISFRVLAVSGGEEIELVAATGAAPPAAVGASGVGAPIADPNIGPPAP
ncbi:MAG: hypothetical protein KDA41_01720 [Planctomycetales bacterium]|nr:hypothetical protein [Planctomycetales bacterium]